MNIVEQVLKKAYISLNTIQTNKHKYLEKDRSTVLQLNKVNQRLNAKYRSRVRQGM